MADASLYLFDGYNLLHAGPFADRRELVDALASFVATTGARGVVVFDGVGDDAERGPLSVRFAPHADTLLERLAAEHRERERVLLVSLGRDRARHGRAPGREPLLADVLPRLRPAEPPRRGAAAGSRTSSTTRRARGSSGCAEASKRAPLQVGFVFSASPC